MDLVGKCGWSPAELEVAADRGFGAIELYLTLDDSVDPDAVVDTVTDGPVTVVAVHTPHAKPTASGPFRRADRIARRLDALLVVHSQYAHHTHIPEFEAMEFESTYAYENNPGASPTHLHETIIGQGHDLVLDVAHLSMASEAYREDVRRFIDSDAVQYVHCADATAIRDGLPFGAGSIDLRWTLDRLAETNLTVVLEVPQDDQRAALEDVHDWTGVTP